MAVCLDLEFSLSAERVMGIDEAGRGPLAGSVFAAAVSLPVDVAAKLIDGSWKGINDSKKLTPAKRCRFAETIKSTPGCVWAVGSATPKEIDEINILNATHLAMRRAAEALAGKSPADYAILVDGLPVPDMPFPSRNVIKGDGKSLFIAAASILAKTARDEDCLRMERLYPGYGFAGHKGYPTKFHFEILRKLGPCPEHRMSFGPLEPWRGR